MKCWKASLGSRFLSPSPAHFIISIDEYSHPQKMWIMNIVWPLTALYFSFFALLGYFSAGRKMSKTAMSAWQPPAMAPPFGVRAVSP
jgi:O-antigen/teichoic acid export membrane protein